MPGICSEIGGKKPGILTQNLERKNFKLVNVVFQDLLLKMSFINEIIYIFVISTLSTKTLILS